MSVPYLTDRGSSFGSKALDAGSGAQTLNPDSLDPTQNLKGSMYPSSIYSGLEVVTRSENQSKP